MARDCDGAGESAGEENNSRAGDSDWGGPDEEGPPLPPPPPLPRAIPHASAASLRSAFASLDAVELEVVFERRACLLKGVPGFLRGPLRAAFRVPL